MSKHKKLSQLEATAICGNDISSSVLYVSALAIAFSGWLAPFALLIVAAVLFLFRKIYGEVVGSMPLNGGAYNALLNTTSKSWASLAATLTLLSYMATAVISATEAIHYLQHMVHGIPTFIAIIVLLGIFMILAIIGIGESAKVAVGIFIFHLTSLVLLTAFALYWISTHSSEIFMSNWDFDIAELFDRNNIKNSLPSMKNALFFGFAAAMLGISGFESSANFVEEQEDGVFPKTLRNMWIIVSIFNPLMALFVLYILPIDDVFNPASKNIILAHMGDKVSGPIFAGFISIDAFLVLSGAVLTSFVGVGGLLERMTLDRIMPQLFLKKNRAGVSYIIPIFFFLLCVSVLLITNADVKQLAGVYTLSFLSVMILFAIGNVFLKLRRAKLPRPEKASWLAVIIAIVAVSIALAGNVMKAPKDFGVFMRYFVPAIVFILIMLNRTTLLKISLNIIRSIFEPIRKFTLFLNKSITETIEDINSQEFVFFTKGDSVSTLNKVMLYIQQNEQTRKIKIVNIIRDENDMPPARLSSDIEVLGREYPNISIDFVILEGKFGPALIKELSEKWDIPINFMFIGTPSDGFPHRIADLGGVRVIV